MAANSCRASWAKTCSLALRAAWIHHTSRGNFEFPDAIECSIERTGTTLIPALNRTIGVPTSLQKKLPRGALISELVAGRVVSKRCWLPGPVPRFTLIRMRRNQRPRKWNSCAPLEVRPYRSASAAPGIGREAQQGAVPLQNVCQDH